MEAKGNVPINDPLETKEIPNKRSVFIVPRIWICIEPDGKANPVGLANSWIPILLVSRDRMRPETVWPLCSIWL